MASQTQLRVGIVGCGYQGGILAETIARCESFRVTACADPDQTAAQRVAKIVDHPAVFTSIEAMVEQAEIDAAVIATSHSSLSECALAAIRAGKHVLAEKPLGVNEQQAAQLEEAVAHAKVIFMAGYSFRYIAGLQKVRELLRAGAVGEIQDITGSIGVGPMSQGWRASPATGGGPMLYVGSHLVDEILWYLGEDPVEIYADIRYRVDTQADETTTFQIKFASGATAQGMVTQTATGFFNNLDIFGNQGCISLRGIDFVYEVRVVSKALPSYAQPTTLHLPQIGDLRILMLLPQLEEFAQAIREQREPSCTVSQGRRVLKVIDAFQASARAGQPVRIG
jgi:UDP-N-acetyl-2-amino-2-deoxyglucuronate dehydrogenase